MTRAATCRLRTVSPQWAPGVAGGSPRRSLLGGELHGVDELRSWRCQGKIVLVSKAFWRRGSPVSSLLRMHRHRHEQDGCRPGAWSLFSMFVLRASELGLWVVRGCQRLWRQLAYRPSTGLRGAVPRVDGLWSRQPPAERTATCSRFESVRKVATPRA